MARIPTDLLAGQVPVVDDVLPASVAATFEAGDEAAGAATWSGTTDLRGPERTSPARAPRSSDVRAMLLAEREPAALAYGSAGRARPAPARPTSCSPSRHGTSPCSTPTSAPTYRYLFRIAAAPVLESAGGAPHTSELPFVFDDTRRQGTPVENADALADEMADLWVDFATDGEPDGWPQVDTGRLMIFGPMGAVPGPDPWTARLDLVETGYDRLGNGEASGS